MLFFRRRRPLHEELARKAALEWEPQYEMRTPLGPAGAAVTGLHALRENDGVLVVDDVDAPGDTLRFVVLAEEVLVEEGDTVPDELSTAFDGRLEPPYRVTGVRRRPRQWALAAQSLETAELPGAGGDTIELAVGEEGKTLLVDGERSFGTAPGLEELARARGLEHFVVHAERLDGDLWEVRVAAL